MKCPPWPDFTFIQITQDLRKVALVHERKSFPLVRQWSVEGEGKNTGHVHFCVNHIWHLRGCNVLVEHPKNKEMGQPCKSCRPCATLIANVVPGCIVLVHCKTKEKGAPVRLAQVSQLTLGMPWVTVLTAFGPFGTEQ